MTLEERIAKLDKRHHRFMLVSDPWHMGMLCQNFPELTAKVEAGMFFQSSPPGDIHGGPCFEVWYSLDRDGNLLQEWGFDPPPPYEVIKNGAQPKS